MTQTRILARVIVLTVTAIISARDLRAQTASVPAAVEPAAVEPATAAPANERACDGCPQRRVGHAFLQNVVVNGFYEVANLARGQATAKITPKTWWANMKQGWVWDLDDFLVNQIGHPYQGSNYFATGRANGLSFWESAGLTAFGSGTWEYFGETNHASLNDLINTTLGGIALGEMFNRTAWLIRDPRATGRSRLLKEIAATVIDPVTGINRFISGDSSRVSGKPADMVPETLGGFASAGVLWQGSNTRAFEADGDPFLEMDLRYGDSAKGRSRTPYDAFAVRLRFGGGSAFSEARVRGRLLGQPLRGQRFQLNVLQDYDFKQNRAYQFGAQSFEVNAAFTGKLSSRTSVRLGGWGGMIALGAVDSLPVGETAPPVEETPPEGEQGVETGPRFYDYGPGAVFGGAATFAFDQRPFAMFVYEGHHLYTLDGIRANHLLHQARLDLLAPIYGPIGLGVSGEYFDRRTFYQDAAKTRQKFHFPQFRAYLTWRLQ
jgi:hypothetical protein